MDALMAMRGALGVRVVVMVRMMVKGFVLDDWEKEKLGMNVGVRTVLMVVIKSDDLRLGEKAQEPGKDRESDATELSLVPLRQQSDAFLCLRCFILYKRSGVSGCWQIA